MLVSSPFDAVCHETFHTRHIQEDDISLNPLHPAVRSRITLFECLQSRGYTTALEFDLGVHLGLVWDLETPRIVTEVKLQDQTPSATYASYMTFLFGDKRTAIALSTDWMQDLMIVAYKDRNAAEQIKHPGDVSVFVDLHRNDTICVFWPGKAFTKGQLEELSLQF